MLKLQQLHDLYRCYCGIYTVRVYRKECDFGNGVASSRKIDGFDGKGCDFYEHGTFSDGIPAMPTRQLAKISTMEVFTNSNPILLHKHAEKK